ncbi:helix-turn-helix domain-containing protein [Lactobacillus iners]|jgi:DNA-binding helix-turn-helix protein|uniref:helix-turn-helix domain-containing protein n=1 Tax=Lactobacillus iners TaxID=147802 RepID=UPI0001E5DA06|nr:XRE family transcriptional regulator [Lactobacillus iners]EFO68759.1 DNA-binding helix-turn-helix protein [Lactobacillus iners LactinV 03V1-b]EGC79796.1 DNA-binding helix-turn-helix protein [Lactobacillus iners UPII 143-D]MCT7718598.1 XRE family transcriptional regulator [Lactobacillus iners]MDK7227158.1 XRE family transcriptional regulator [Lactobacillus iners]MDK7362561.1 XRE family transcriptional regulator [Lactobacillus iners]
MKESKIIFGQMIDYFRKQNNLTMEELGQKLGKATSSISRWVSGERYPKIEEIEQIANFFNTDIYTLIFGFNYNEDSKSDLLTVYNQLADIRKHKVYSYAQQQLDEQNKKRSIYVVGTSAAGEPIEYGDFDSEMIQTDVPAKADKAIHIKGDSMEPKIASNSIIFYHEQPTLEIGEIGIFEINGSAVTCKKYYVDYESKKIILKSINPKYEPMYFARDQVRILGKVVF